MVRHSGKVIFLILLATLFLFRSAIQKKIDSILLKNIRNFTLARVKKNPNIDFSMGRVSGHPLRWLEVQNIQLRDKKTGAVLAKIGSVRVQYSLRDLQRYWREPPKILQKIQLSHALVNVVREKSGEFNWTKAFPPKKKKKPPPLLFSLEAQDVRLLFEDRGEKKVKEKLKVAVKGSFHFYPTAFFKAKVEKQGSRVQVLAQWNMVENKILAAITAKTQLAPLRRYLPSDLPLKVERGEVSWDGLVSTGENYSQPSLIGLAKIKTLLQEKKLGSLRVKGVAVTYEDMLHILSLEERGRGQQVEGRGWLLNFRKPYIVGEGRGEVSGELLHEFVHITQPVRGRVAIRFLAEGKPKDVRAHIEAMGNVSVGDLRASRLKVSADYGQKQVYASAAFQAMNGSVQMRGGVDLRRKKPKGAFLVQAKDIQLGLLPKGEAETPLPQGAVDGVSWVSFGSPLKAVAEVYASDLILSQNLQDGGVVQLKKAESILHFSGTTLNILEAYGKKGPTQIMGRGTVDLKRKTLNSQADAFFLSPQITSFKKLSVTDWSVPLFFHAQVQGDLRAPTFSAQGFAGHGSFSWSSPEGKGSRQIPAVLEGARFQALGSQNRVTLKTSLYSDGGQVGIQGELFPKKKQIALWAKGERVSIGDILNRTLGKDQGVQELVNFQGRLNGDWKSPKGEAMISLSPLMLKGKKVSDGGEIQLVFANQNLSVKEGTLLFSGEPLFLKGEVDLSKNIIFNVTATAKDWKIAPFHFKDASGVASFTTAIRGTLNKHTITVDLSAPKLQISGQNFHDIEVQLALQKEQEKASKSSPIPKYRGTFQEKGGYQEGTLATQGTLLTGGEEAPVSLQGDVSWQGVEVAGLLEALLGKKEVSGASQGALHYLVNFKPKPPQTDFYPYPEVSGKVSLTGGEIADHPYDIVQANITYKENICTINPLVFKTPSGELTAEGSFNFNGDVNLKVETNQIQLSLLNEIPIPAIQNVLSEYPVKGKGSANLLIRGNLQNPEMIGVVKASEASFGEEPIEQLIASWKYLQNRLQVDRLFLKSREETLEGKGSIPFKWKSKEIPLDQPLQLSLSVPTFSLQRLTRIFPNLGTLAGTGSAQVALSGTLRHPNWDGGVHLDAENVHWQGLDSPPVDAQLDLQLKGNSLLVKSFAAHLPGGEIQAKGKVDFAPSFRNARFVGWEPEQLTARAFTVGNPELKLKSFQGRILGSVLISTDKDKASLEGDILASDASYFLTSSQKKLQAEKLPSLLRKLQLNLSVRVGDNVWIKSDTLSMLMKTEQKKGMQLTGTLEDPSILGTLVAERGTLALYARLFKVEEAAVFFEPGHGFEPTIFAKINTTVNDGANEVPIEITVDGPARQMNVSIRSPMRAYQSKTQSELLALLVGKQKLQEDPRALLEETARNAFTTYGNRYVMQAVERKIEQLLGLRQFSVEFGGTGNYTITLKEDLMPRLVFSFRNVVAERDQKQLGLDYLIPGFARGYNPAKILVVPTRNLLHFLFPTMTDLRYFLSYTFSIESSAKNIQTTGLKLEFHF